MAEIDLIERKAVYKALDNIGGCGATDDLAKGYDAAIDAAIFIVENTPAADVAPVRHGCWVKEKSDVLIHWRCSVCEKCYFLEEPNADYCPRCGAKMDGGD